MGGFKEVIYISGDCIDACMFKSRKDKLISQKVLDRF